MPPVRFCFSIYATINSNITKPFAFNVCSAPGPTRTGIDPVTRLLLRRQLRYGGLCKKCLSWDVRPLSSVYETDAYKLLKLHRLIKLFQKSILFIL